MPVAEADQKVLETVYRLFNARDLEDILLWMQADVDWPNGMEGGRVHGHEGVRDYWTRQWKLLDPRVRPMGFTSDADGRIVVDVHQVVLDLAGKELVNQRIEHIYTMEDGLIRRMDIGSVARSSVAD